MDEAARGMSQLTSPGSSYPSHPPAEDRQSRGSGRRGRARGFTSVLVILALVGAAETTGIWKPLVGFALRVRRHNVRGAVEPTPGSAPKVRDPLGARPHLLEHCEGEPSLCQR